MSKIAQSTLWLELIAIVVSLIFYYLACYKKKNQDFLKIARISYFTFTALTSLASILLFYFFLTHDFRFKYVIQYSSLDLPLHYLISSFWAGQEGSFLLWVFLGAWLGLLLMFKFRKTESHVMVLYNLPHIFLSILLIKQSPFAMTIVPPADGNGLNMLLQDFWMVIHPPIVFLGYAAYTIPFALAMASLWRREYNDWIKQGLSWAVFAFVSLGAGIIIGGVWSYKVLGWGGYWGWDPVENASLLPWLTGTALLHGMILQKSTGRLAKTNYVLAALSFLLVIYSTFLTRSGILADFSVHSFVDLGITGWLVFYIVVFIIISLYLIATRAQYMPLPQRHKEKEISFFSREFGLAAAVILLCLSALLTGLGTSAPLITRVLEKASKVTNQFYINMNLPIAVLIGLFLTYIPLLKWGKNDPKKLFSNLITGCIAAIIASIITLVHGFPGILVFIMVFFAGFTVGVNLELMISLIRKNVFNSSGAITHLGVGLMFLGFVATTAYDKSERIALPQDENMTSMGYQLKFNEAKISPEAKGTRVSFLVEIEKNNKIVLGQPDIYVEGMGNGENKRFHHPFIRRGVLSDLYISPETYEENKKADLSENDFVIKKGETVSFHDYKITFLSYDLSNMGMNQTQYSMSVGANLSVSYKNNNPISLKPIYRIGVEQDSLTRVKLPGPADAFLTLVGIDATQKNIRLYYDGPTMTPETETESVPTFYAEVSIKPGMSLLWLGVTLILIGGVISIYRRWPKE